MVESDNVDHPRHYNVLGATCPGCSRPIECIDVVEHMDFTIGSAVKYLWRCGHKGDILEDLRKACWYIQRKIAQIEMQEGGRATHGQAVTAAGLQKSNGHV